MPLPGPWRHGSIKEFLRNYLVEGKRYPECGSPDDGLSIDAACKMVPLVALYAGRPDLLHVAETAIRATQNTDMAVRYGLAFARCLEKLIMGKTTSPAEALGDTVAELRAEDSPGCIASELEDVLVGLAGLSLSQVGEHIRPPGALTPRAGFA